MQNKKLFTLYIRKEIGKVDLNIYVELNLEELVSEKNEILTEVELKQLEEITFNILKRANRIRGVDELRMFDRQIENEESQKFIVSCVNLGKELIDKEELTKREEEFINNLDVIIDKYFK